MWGSVSVPLRIGSTPWRRKSGPPRPRRVSGHGRRRTTDPAVALGGPYLRTPDSEQAGGGSGPTEGAVLEPWGVQKKGPTRRG